MLAAGRTYITTGPWLWIFPGLSIVLAVMGFNLLGNALRYARMTRICNDSKNGLGRRTRTI
jgi:peptide/nickel transport system permease protein